MTTHMTLFDPKTDQEREVLVDFHYEPAERAEYDRGVCIYPGIDSSAEIISMMFVDDQSDAMYLLDKYEPEIVAHCCEEVEE